MNLPRALEKLECQKLESEKLDRQKSWCAVTFWRKFVICHVWYLVYKSRMKIFLQNVPALTIDKCARQVHQWAAGLKSYRTNEQIESKFVWIMIRKMFVNSINRFVQCWPKNPEHSNDAHKLLTSTISAMLTAWDLHITWNKTIIIFMDTVSKPSILERTATP